MHISVTGRCVPAHSEVVIIHRHKGSISAAHCWRHLRAYANGLLPLSPLKVSKKSFSYLINTMTVMRPRPQDSCSTWQGSSSGEEEEWGGVQAWAGMTFHLVWRLLSLVMSALHTREDFFFSHVMGWGSKDFFCTCRFLRAGTEASEDNLPSDCSWRWVRSKAWANYSCSEKFKNSQVLWC